MSLHWYDAIYPVVIAAIFGTLIRSLRVKRRRGAERELFRKEELERYLDRNEKDGK